MGWTQTAPLQELNKLRIGVDGAYFIRKLTSTKEPCLMATGGLPLGFRSSFEEELRLFITLGIDLFFVFNGLPWKKEKPFSVEDRRPLIRNQAWESYAAGRTDAALSQWSSAGTVAQNDLLFEAFKILDEFQIPYIRAPYAALGQLAYMDNSANGYFHAVYAGSEFLLFPVDRVITNFDFAKSAFSYIDKKFLLTQLAVIPDQFLDMGLLAGFDYISTFPGLLEPSAGGFSFQLAVDAVRMNGSGYSLVQKSLASPAVSKMNYLELFAKTRAIVKNHLVWTDQGTVAPMNPSTAPSEILGPKLPDELYFLLIKGWISPTMVQAITTGYLVEANPLCGNLNELKSFSTGPETTRLKSQALAFLSANISEDLKSKEVESYFWFEPTSGHKLAFGQEIVSCDASKKWNLPTDLLKEAKISRKPDSLEFCFAFLANPTYAKQTTVLKKQDKIDPSNQIILANMMALSQCNYVDTKNHQLTPLGLVLSKSMNNFYFEGIGESLWTTFELLKAGALQAKGLTPSYDLASDIENKDKRAVWLLSRLACILSFKTQKTPYNGPLFRDLIGFHAFVRIMTRSLRNLSEMALVTRLLDSDGFTSLSHIQIPFSDDNSTIFGIAIALYLQSCIKSSKSADALKSVKEQVGPFFADLESQIKTFFKFWKSVIYVLKEGKGPLGKFPNISADITNFLEVDGWVSKFAI